MSEAAAFPATRPLRVLYFAWVRERVGVPEETLNVPGDVRTVAELVEWLAGQSEAHAHALDARDSLRAAIDKRHAPPGTPLGDAREVALFPPMTGG